MASLTRSIFARRIDVDAKRCVVYHSLYGNPLIVERTLVDRLWTRAGSGTDLPATLEMMSVAVSQFRKSCLLVPAGFDESRLQDTLRSDFLTQVRRVEHLAALSMVVSETCNFHCRRCLPTLLPNSEQKTAMRLEDAVRATDAFFDLVKERAGKIQVFFGGREPTTNWPVLEQVVRRAAQHASDFRLDVMFVLFTNAASITAERAAFLAQFDVHIVSSLDGLREENNARRGGHRCEDAFDRTLRGWAQLKKTGNPITQITCTVSKENWACLSAEFLDFLVEQGIRSVHVNPDFMSVAFSDVPALSDRLERFIADGERRGIHVGGQWRRVADNLFHIVFNSINNAFCGAYQAHALTVRPGGIVTVCPSDPRALGYGGQIQAVLQSETYLNELAGGVVGHVPGCGGCEIEGFCMGGCAVFRQLLDSDGRSRDAMCAFFKTMFAYTVRDWALAQIHPDLARLESVV